MSISLDDNILHGCIIPGTSNVIADTSDNQSGFFALAATNDLIGNRASNSLTECFFSELLLEEEAVLGRFAGQMQGLGGLRVMCSMGMAGLARTWCLFFPIP